MAWLMFLIKFFTSVAKHSVEVSAAVHTNHDDTIQYAKHETINPTVK